MLARTDPVAVHLPCRSHSNVALVKHIARHIRRLSPLIVVHTRRSLRPRRIQLIRLKHSRHLQRNVHIGRIGVERVDEEAWP